MLTTLKKDDIITGTIETYTGYKRSESFTIKKFVGAGGTGLVYLCYGKDKKHYALKELCPKELQSTLKRNDQGIAYNSLASQSSKNTFEWYKNNLKREVALCQKASISRCMDNNDPFYLSCLGILNVNETSIYAIYETYAGRTLEEYFEEFKNQDNQDYTRHLIKMLTIIAIAAYKLHHIHLNNILHLDITPANIFLIDYGHGCINQTEGEIPCFLDFGNAYDKHNVTSKEVRFSFSEGYSAPELLIRSKDKNSDYEINAATDTYSLVAILYEALIGQKHDTSSIVKQHKDWRKFLDVYPEIVRKDLYYILQEGLSTWQPRLFFDAKDLANTLKGIRAKLVDNNEDLNVFDYYFEESKKTLEEIEDVVETLEKITLSINKIQNRKDKIRYKWYGGIEDDKYKNLDYKSVSAANLCKIGLEYRSKKRFDEAFKFFELAYNKGDVCAGCFLGFAYGNGEGVEKNKKVANKLIFEAYQKKDTTTMINLGAEYYVGESFIKKNYRKAVKIFKELCTYEESIHYKDSLYFLGRCYEKGHGVIKNKKKAMVLYEKAIQNGSKAAQEAIDRLLN